MAPPAVFEAVAQGDADRVEILLDGDPELLSGYWRGDNLLTQAAKWRHVSVVRLLLEKGPDIDLPNFLGNTALHMAAKCDDEELVELLLNSGADVSRKGFLDWTALISASAKGYAGMVRLLLRYMEGRGLDERTEGGCTALWYACYRGHTEIIRTLLLAGADHTIAENNGETPLHMAKENGRLECVDLIQVSGPSLSYPLYS